MSIFFLITLSTKNLKGMAEAMPSPYPEYQYQHLNIFPRTIWDSGDKHTTQNHFLLWMYLNSCPNHQSPAAVDQTLGLNSSLQRSASRQIWIKWALSLWLQDWWSRKTRVTVLPLSFLLLSLHLSPERTDSSISYPSRSQDQDLGTKLELSAPYHCSPQVSICSLEYRI